MNNRTASEPMHFSFNPADQVARAESATADWRGRSLAAGAEQDAALWAQWEAARTTVPTQPA
jgi:hypothetical protein